MRVLPIIYSSIYLLYPQQRLTLIIEWLLYLYCISYLFLYLYVCWLFYMHWLCCRLSKYISLKYHFVCFFTFHPKLQPRFSSHCKMHFHHQKIMVLEFRCSSSICWHSALLTQDKCTKNFNINVFSMISL